MRASFWILCLALCALLQSCTAIAYNRATRENERRQTRSAMTAFYTAARPPAPGTALTLTLADGRTVQSAFVVASSDSIRVEAGAFAVRDIDTIDQSWSRTSVIRPTLIGLILDVLFLTAANWAVIEAFAY